jgi:hypothetical protein
MNEHRVGILVYTGTSSPIFENRPTLVHRPCLVRGKTCDQQVKQAIGNKEPLQCAHTLMLNRELPLVSWQLQAQVKKHQLLG